MKDRMRSLFLLVVALALLLFFYTMEYGKQNPDLSDMHRVAFTDKSDTKATNSRYVSTAADLADSGLKTGGIESQP